MTETRHPEPWLRGTLGEVRSVARAVLHALQLAEEDLEKWCAALSDAQLNARPGGLASVAFQIRHIARSVDRLLTYAEGRQLSTAQIEESRTEMEPSAQAAEIFSELRVQLRRAEQGFAPLPRQKIWKRPERWGEERCQRQSAAYWFTWRTIRNATPARRSRRQRWQRRSPRKDAHDAAKIGSDSGILRRPCFLNRPRASCSL
jgi:hypothetical protein